MTSTYETKVNLTRTWVETKNSPHLVVQLWLFKSSSPLSNLNYLALTSVHLLPLQPPSMITALIRKVSLPRTSVPTEQARLSHLRRASSTTYYVVHRPQPRKSFTCFGKPVTSGCYKYFDWTFTNKRITEHLFKPKAVRITNTNFNICVGASGHVQCYSLWSRPKHRQT